MHNVQENFDCEKKKDIINADKKKKKVVKENVDGEEKKAGNEVKNRMNA